jgi:hypothetical protein
VVQIAMSANYGIDNGEANRATQIVGARIATNLSAIPDSVRQGLVTTYLIPEYAPLLEIAAVARQDQLGEFRPGLYRHYRALGPPRKLVREALTTVRSTLALWCKLAPGDTKSQVYDQMGAPHGDDFAPWAAGLAKHGYGRHAYAEWDVGTDMLIADFQNGLVATLQAYAAPTLNQATDIPCGAAHG